MVFGFFFKKSNYFQSLGRHFNDAFPLAVEISLFQADT